MEGKKSHSLVFLPLPGMGHLIAMIELAKNLLKHNLNFNVTILTFQPRNVSPQLESYITSMTNSNPNFSFHHLPTIDVQTTDFIQLVDLHKPNLKSALADLQTSLSIAALVVDFFCVGIVDVTKELCIPSYVFFTSCATILGEMLYFPTLDRTLPPGKKMAELHQDGISVHVPTLTPPVPALALPSQFLDRGGKMYDRIIDLGYRFRETDGIIVNSFEDLEPYAVKALGEGKCIPDHPTPSLYFVGPMLNIGTDEDASKMECLRWLDGQPNKSVVFLCFGSMGGFSKEQAREIAVGLEKSGCRFLWVLRSARYPQPKGHPLPPMDADLDDVLPHGFAERTKDCGMVWPTFAPQSKILAHRAIGGFVTHCGWNSCLESLWYGVPMLTWPLYAEQHATAFSITEEMEVAIKLNTDRLRDNWASADDVERGVRCLMVEDVNVRAKVLDMKEKGRKALEEGGSSYLSMRSLAKALASSEHN